MKIEIKDAHIKQLVKLLMSDLDDRSGYDLPHDDDDVLKEWRKEWHDIIEAWAIKRIK